MKFFCKKYLTLAACAAILFCFLSPCVSAKEPQLSAASAILIEAQSGRVVLEHNADQRRGIASTTKIMTALVVLQNAELSDVIEVSGMAVGVEGSSIYLREGERLTVEELLYAMLLNSANDAATALAIGCFGSIEACAAEMNRYAAKLGMTNSHFENPHGLDSEGHYSTARDMATLGRVALDNPQFAKIVSTYKKNIPLCSNEGVRVLINHNRLLKMMDCAIGIKTGFTKKSGRCLVSAAESDGVRLIAVTLSDPNDWHDHSEMFSYGFEQFSHYDMLSADQYSYEVDVFGGDCEKLLCKNELGFGITLEASANAPTLEVDLPRYLTAPIKKGEQVGKIDILQDGEVISSIPIVAQNDVNVTKLNRGFFEKMFSHIK
jgi:D-alanyl-D-alanine carboxypeptidase (penicillin-binding protein 5/6)